MWPPGVCVEKQWPYASKTIPNPELISKLILSKTNPRIQEPPHRAI